MSGLAQLRYSPLPRSSGPYQNRFFSGVTSRFSDNTFAKHLTFKPLRTSHDNGVPLCISSFKFQVPCAGGADGGSIGIGRGGGSGGDGNPDDFKPWWDNFGRMIYAFVNALVLGLVGVSVCVIGLDFLVSTFVVYSILSLFDPASPELSLQFLPVIQEATFVTLVLIMVCSLGILGCHLFTEGLCMPPLLGLLVDLWLLQFLMFNPAKEDVPPCGFEMGSQSVEEKVVDK